MIFSPKIVLNQGTSRVYPLPYQISAQNDGLHVCYPEKLVQPEYVLSTFLDNLIFGATSGLGSTRQVVAFDELSVTLR